MKAIKKFFLSHMIMIIIFNYIFVSTANAYSYGDPGKENFAEAYKEIDQYTKDGQWDQAFAVYENYQKEFELYFTKPKKFIEEAFDKKDRELLLKSYQAALALNIERRLHFAEESFDEYGQAKLLLAKARGTYDVLYPLAVKELGQEKADEIYKAFDDMLVSLGNPGLFGIGNQENDPETFNDNLTFIIDRISTTFPLPNNSESDGSHLTEENLGIDTSLNDESHPFWLWFTIALVIIFVLIVFIQRRKKRTS
ncbi:hypothetical protein [Bacillus alveayuensis]|jgi:hypothetical protein|uniref:hypothetical protein n=1 Tax=Aeribacillus alveayuensis TaxID=279215 RepID=UPI0005D1254A|nr:hypothetical protein [Bacillus alveayuensis]